MASTTANQLKHLEAEYGRFWDIIRDNEFVDLIRAMYEYSYCDVIALIIEGLRANRAYIEFWPIFIFCRIELIFGRLTCFDMKSIVP